MKKRLSLKPWPVDVGKPEHNYTSDVYSAGPIDFLTLEQYEASTILDTAPYADTDFAFLITPRGELMAFDYHYVQSLFHNDDWDEGDGDGDGDETNDMDEPRIEIYRVEPGQTFWCGGPGRAYEVIEEEEED